MSPFLLKIYAFLVLVTLMITNSLLHVERVTEKVQTDISTIDVEKQLEPISEAPKKNIAVSAPTTTQTLPINEESDYEHTIKRGNSCSTPISYTLTAFDPRFNISKSDFLKTAHEATELWNNALGKKLFIYSNQTSPSTLTLNLVYDERQARTDHNTLLSAEIDNSSKAATILEKEYTAMQVTFTDLKDEYATLFETFTMRQKKYNETVEMWNEKGGAPKTEYDALTQEKGELQKDAAILTKKQEAIKTLLASINEKITRHNELIVFANQKIDENNTGANKKFTEGVYNSGSNKITIYQFSDTTKLKRVLAHEFGHALGIEHTTNKQSIMYAVNTATTTVLSNEDIQALRAICLE